MKTGRTIRKGQNEAGIALLISIFILLLISVVAIALIVSSGTETSLAGNYRSATGVYYAALAGLEEGRGRLSKKNPNYFGNTSPGFLPSPGTPLAVGAPVYVINPTGAEIVAPWDPGSIYPDLQYNQEFASSALTLPNPSPSTSSIWNNSPLNTLAFPGPLYKWVRINAVSARSLNVPVAPSYSPPPYDSTTPVFYDGTHLNISNSGAQVFEVTSLAVLPNASGQNSQKLIQYLIAPIPIALPPFNAALSLLGSSFTSTVSYTSPAPNTNFFVKGNNQDCSGNPDGTYPPQYAIGVIVSGDVGTVESGGNGGLGIQPLSVWGTNYTGSASNPDIVNMLTFPVNYRSPSGLDAVVQAIIPNADGTIPLGSAATQQAYLTALVSSSAMSPTSPMTLVANGDLDLTGWHNTGYGLLLVTGTLTYDPDATWNGIVLVIGQGALLNSKRGTGQINGAVMVAQTRVSGTLIAGSYLGASKVNYNSGSDPASPPSNLGGNGIYYSNCWIQRAMPTTGNKVLSFHEITQ
jgi:hypothetical protein